MAAIPSCLLRFRNTNYPLFSQPNESQNHQQQQLLLHSQFFNSTLTPFITEIKLLLGIENDINIAFPQLDLLLNEDSIHLQTLNFDKLYTFYKCLLQQSHPVGAFLVVVEETSKSFTKQFQYLSSLSLPPLTISSAEEEILPPINSSSTSPCTVEENEEPYYDEEMQDAELYQQQGEEYVEEGEEGEYFEEEDYEEGIEQVEQVYPTPKYTKQEVQNIPMVSSILPTITEPSTSAEIKEVIDEALVVEELPKTQDGESTGTPLVQNSEGQTGSFVEVGVEYQDYEDYEEADVIQDVTVIEPDQPTEVIEADEVASNIFDTVEPPNSTEVIEDTVDYDEEVEEEPPSNFIKGQEADEPTVEDVVEYEEGEEQPSDYTEQQEDMAEVLQASSAVVEISEIQEASGTTLEDVVEYEEGEEQTFDYPEEQEEVIEEATEAKDMEEVIQAPSTAVETSEIQEASESTLEDVEYEKGEEQPSDYPEQQEEAVVETSETQEASEVVAENQQESSDFNNLNTSETIDTADVVEYQDEEMVQPETAEYSGEASEQKTTEYMQEVEYQEVVGQLTQEGEESFDHDTQDLDPVEYQEEYYEDENIEYYYEDGTLVDGPINEDGIIYIYEDEQNETNDENDDGTKRKLEDDEIGTTDANKRIKV